MSADCSSDIVTTNHLKDLTQRCVYIAPLESEDPHVGKVVRAVIEKEFIRKKIEVCDPNSATAFITGATFLTTRATASQGLFGNEFASSQAIEIVSLVAKDSRGEVLLSASYENTARHNASKLAKEFGAAGADKLK